MTLQQVIVEGKAGLLETFLAQTEKSNGTEPLLLLCHGLPLNRDGGRIASLQLPELGERLSEASGWAIGVASLRGVGDSPGVFSASAWKDDLDAVISQLSPGRSITALAGFGLGGALALRVAADDDRIRGVAALAATADLDQWCGSALHFSTACLRAGVIGDFEEEDALALLADVMALDPREAAARIPPKRMLIVHGSNDQITSVEEARNLLAAAEGHAQLRIIQGAGHWLRADPRMFATLLGWLDRQI